MSPVTLYICVSVCVIQRQNNKNLINIFYSRVALEDKLEGIFTMQNKLATTIQNHRYPFRTDERISVLCTAIIHEAAELQRLTSWKWWKTPQDFDTEKAKEELADIWHFVVQASLELGLTPKELYLAYVNKNKINFQRQKDGY